MHGGRRAGALTRSIWTRSHVHGPQSAWEHGLPAMRLATSLLLLLATACATARAPLDVAAWESEGRVLPAGEESRLLDMRRPVRWTDGEVELRCERASTLFSDGLRLLTEIEGSSGTRTTMVVDTGSTFTMVSASAPLARDLLLGRDHRYGIANKPGETGHLGLLPEARVGSLRGRELPVAITDRVHSTASPANLLGITHVFHLQLEGDTERWWLRSGSFRRPSMEPGWSRVPLLPGTQLLRVRTPAGSTALAMLDSGAPTSTVVKGAKEGAYDVIDEGGRTVLRVDANDTVDWPGMQWQGEPIVLLIGMDALSARPGRITFDAATWALPPWRLVR